MTNIKDLSHSNTLNMIIFFRKCHMEDKQKSEKRIPEDLSDLHHDEPDRNSRLACILKLCWNNDPPIRALAFFKFSFDRISFGSILTLHPFLGYVNLFILGWSAKFRTTHANSAFLAEFTVFTCPIDSIDQYGLRIISMSFFILFNR